MKPLMKTTTILLAWLAFASSAQALKHCPSATTLDTRILPYSTPSAVSGQYVTVDDDQDIRQSVMTSVIGTHRSTHGLFTLPPGSMFKIIYRDGSRECGAVISSNSSVMGDPIPDTARRPSDPIIVEDTKIYIQKYQFERPAGSPQAWFNVCYDYYTNGVLTDSECHIEPF